jgi:hydrogenase/urease accessory protein HupE
MGHRATLVAIAVVLASPPARAHILQRSFSDVKPTPQGVSVLFAFDPDDLDPTLLARFDDDGSGRISREEIAAHETTLVALAQAGYVVRQSGERCAAELRQHKVGAESTMLDIHWVFACPKEGALSLALPLLDELRTGHVHILTVRLPEGIQGAGLSREQPEWHERGRLWSDVWSFFVLGLEHIATGYDHLLFLFGLLLVATRLRALVLVVTSFTVAHSITLIGAALGAVSLPSRLVEPAIALTIAYVGAENLWKKDPRHRPVLTFALGLVHGFGFAGVLSETALPERGRVLALLAFNLGVEAGQLAVVLALTPLLVWLARSRHATIVRRAGSAVVLACGLVWFVLRVLPS